MTADLYLFDYLFIYLDRIICKMKYKFWINCVCDGVYISLLLRGLWSRTTSSGDIFRMRKVLDCLCLKQGLKLTPANPPNAGKNQLWWVTYISVFNISCLKYQNFMYAFVTSGYSIPRPSKLHRHVKIHPNAINFCKDTFYWYWFHLFSNSLHLLLL